jgi:hypothetical protein
MISDHENYGPNTTRQLQDRLNSRRHISKGSDVNKKNRRTNNVAQELERPSLRVGFPLLERVFSEFLCKVVMDSIDEMPTLATEAPILRALSN